MVSGFDQPQCSTFNDRNRSTINLELWTSNFEQTTWNCCHLSKVVRDAPSSCQLDLTLLYPFHGWSTHVCRASKGAARYRFSRRYSEIERPRQHKRHSVKVHRNPRLITVHLGLQFIEMLRSQSTAQANDFLLPIGICFNLQCHLRLQQNCNEETKRNFLKCLRWSIEETAEISAFAELSANIWKISWAFDIRRSCRNAASCG